MTRLEQLLPLLARLSSIEGEIKSLAELAAEDGRSPHHLQRLFTAEVGESPLQYSRRVRLQRAAASLLVTDKSVLDIALDAGFDSHEGFSRAFRAMFDVSPSAFREQKDMFKRLVSQYQVHLETAHRTAPCVGLYRVSLTHPSMKSTLKGDPIMPYEVTTRVLTETPFLCMKRQVKPDQIAEALASMLVPVFQYATAQGIPFAGPPTVRYLSFGPGLMTLEAGMPIVGFAEGEGEIRLSALPGGLAATTIHKGPYDTLNLAHEAVQTWIAENSEDGNGAPWEVYITDPGEVPDPEAWLTEIIHPLKAK